jgi:endogenous inhibitor of DNA gyrase (YacG/DUF329 family)
MMVLTAAPIWRDNPGVRCPVCNEPVLREGNRFYPFCSERCKLVDLSKWLGEEYRIPGPPEPPPPGGREPDSGGPQVH